MRAVAFYLLVGGHGAEDYFGEFTGLEGAVGYAARLWSRRLVLGGSREREGWRKEGTREGTREEQDIPDYFAVAFHNSHRQMRAVVDKASNVLFRHLGELFLEDAFHAREDHVALLRIVVVDDLDADLAFALLGDRGLSLGRW